MEEEICFTARTNWLQAIGWTCILFFSFCFFGAALSGAISAAVMFIPFIFLGAAIPVCFGTITLNESGVQHCCLLGTFYIDWSEVETIESGSGNFVIGNPQKRVTMAEPGYWTGKDRNAAIYFLYEMASQRGIDIQERGRATFCFSKNSRVRAKGNAMPEDID